MSTLDDDESRQFEDIGLPADELDAVLAMADVVRRSGGALEFGHEDVQGWHASAKFKGTRIIVEHGVGPGAIADELATRVLHNGRCTSCRKIIVAGDRRVLATSVTNLDGTHEKRTEADVQRARLCFWERQRRTWVRECGAAAPAGSSREKLAQALIEEGYVHAAMIAAARAARYDDYLQDLTPFPQMLLIEDLKQYGPQAQALRQRVMAGEFDGTAEESQAWAESEDGRATFAELVRPARQGTPPPPPPGHKDDSRKAAEAARRNRRGRRR